MWIQICGDKMISKPKGIIVDFFPQKKVYMSTSNSDEIKPFQTFLDCWKGSECVCKIESGCLNE